jgi:hypothetical protein
MMKVTLMGHDMSKDSNEPVIVFETEIQRNQKEATES